MSHRDRRVTRRRGQARCAAVCRRLARPVTALLVAALLFLRAGGARAAAPANDTFEGAVSAPLGFSQMLDTTEATTDEDDAQLNQCGGSATDASVWYAITLASEGYVVVDVSQSDYS